MSSEVMLANESKTPEVWYNRLSEEEKYDAYHHPGGPCGFDILPPLQKPQWVLEWSEFILDLSILPFLSVTPMSGSDRSSTRRTTLTVPLRFISLNDRSP